VNTDESGAERSGESDQLIRYLVLRLEDDLHALTAWARLLGAARRAPGRRFFGLKYSLVRRLIDIRYALERHAAAARDTGADATGRVTPVVAPGTGTGKARPTSLARGLNVSCPHCHAPSGAGCRTPSGKTLREPHSARRVAAHTAYLDELHPQRDPPWATFAPAEDDELPIRSSLRRRDPHDPLNDPLGDGRRLRHLLRALEEDLPLLSEHIEERWRMRRRTVGSRFHELTRPLYRGIREVTAALQRLSLPAPGPDQLRVEGDG
jgi:hypothetical protein